MLIYIYNSKNEFNVSCRGLNCRFTWFSWRVLFTLTCTFGSAIMTSLCLFRLFFSGIDIYKTSMYLITHAHNVITLLDLNFYSFEKFFFFSKHYVLWKYIICACVVLKISTALVLFDDGSCWKRASKKISKTFSTSAFQCIQFRHSVSSFE